MSATAGITPRLGRVGAWMGILFAPLFIVGTFLSPSPKDSSSTQEWARLYTSSSHRTAAIVGAYLAVFGLLAFLWFASRLRSRLGEGGGMMLTFGSVFAALGMVANLVFAAIAGAKVFASAPVPPGAFAQQFNSLGAGILVVPGALAAGLFVAIASYLSRREGALPGWLTIAGYVVAVLQLAAVVFIPLMLVPIWVLVASIVMLRREAGAAAST